MAAYYNEIDAFAAEWLRQLIAAGHIAAGDVDTRSIEDVQADDLTGYDQCHFFAGIGGWSAALRLAGWPDDRPVWTGSCPCQPLSSAGQRKGHADERHIWPAFYRLITECRPAIVFGEQVASKDGREWFAGVRADLEDARYAGGAADLCAAGVAAPNIRQRIYWVAVANDQRRRARTRREDRQEAGDRRGMGYASRDGRRQEHPHPGGRVERGEAQEREQRPRDDRSPGRLEHADSAGLQPREQAATASRHRPPVEPASGNGFWSRYDLIPFADGKVRRVEPGTFPLAHGIPARVGRLRGYGNAINPELAAVFIDACHDVIEN